MKALPTSFPSLPSLPSRRRGMADRIPGYLLWPLFVLGALTGIGILALAGLIGGIILWDKFKGEEEF